MKYLFSIFLLTLTVSCSKSGPGPACVDTLCAPGHSECMGNYQATCHADGRAWDLVFCGARRFCKNGACKKGVCEPGKHFCDTGRATVCNDTGTKLTTVRCPADRPCQYGFCMDRRCHEGDKICNNNEMLVCASGLWSTKQCAEGESCNPETKACVKKICTPFQAVCSNDLTKSIACNNNGSGYSTTTCKSNQTCKDGFCMKKLCAPVHDTVIHEDLSMDAESMSTDTLKHDTADATYADTGIKMENRAEINGSPVAFTVKYESSYSPSEHKLRIALMGPPAGIGTRQEQVTILLTGIQENQTGQFNCQDQGSVSVTMYYKWGKYPSTGDCAEFDYVATKCSVTISKFGMQQGLVTGTFSAPVMEDCKQDSTTSVIKNGVFNTIRAF